MRNIYSKVTPSLLLHIVYRKTDLQSLRGRVDIVSDNNFIQVCALNLENGHTFRPHQHIMRDSPPISIAQESWVVIQGSVRLFLFDIDGTQLAHDVLEQGDISITLHGGHTYEIIGDDTLVYEYKTGPYTGQENDKVFFDDQCDI